MRRTTNPCFANADDLAALGLAPDSLVTVTSAHGSIRAVVQTDSTLRRGVLSMTHGFGGLPGDDDPLLHGASTSRLLSLSKGAQSISAMPHMSAIAVSLTPVDVATPV